MISRKVLLRALACALLALLPAQDQENQLYDIKLRLLSRTQSERPESVLVLEMPKEDFDSLRRRFSPRESEETENGLGPWREKFEALRNQFFWDDHVYEELLKRILAEQPKKLLVSFFYGDSLVLLRNNSSLHHLARNPSVLWASQFDLEQKLLKPAPELTGTENYGFNNLYPDADGVVRRAWLIRDDHMSLPFCSLLDGHSPIVRSLPLAEPFLIHYAGPPGSLPSCKVGDLFGPTASRCGSLKDKTVILASSGTVVGGANLYKTPVGYMSRGELLGNILLTAQSEGPYIPVNLYLLFLLALGHSILLANIILRFHGRQQILLICGVLAVEGIAVLLLMRTFLLQLPLVPFLLATVASFMAFQALKFAQQESKRWQAEKKAEYLRELDELKSNFTSLMSHDLKTPIAKVQALTERLQREARGLTDDQRLILEAIQRSNDELSHYILSILNFQKIESQEIKLHRKSHDINLMIEDVAQRLFPLAQDRGVHLALELEPMFPVELDEKLIRQVLNNLIDNAIKYNHTGTNVHVRSVDLGNFVEVSVKDDGVGMEQEQIARLFKKFSRSEKGTAERVKGTGLGLYLCKYFIEKHGGEIGVESAPGKGTKFWFRLPVQH
jgi:two-component system, OmpR family, phosphate regulon sensor histidine kinase PhoR